MCKSLSHEHVWDENPGNYFLSHFVWKKYMSKSGLHISSLSQLKTGIFFCMRYELIFLARIIADNSIQINLIFYLQSL